MSTSPACPARADKLFKRLKTARLDNTLVPSSWQAAAGGMRNELLTLVQETDVDGELLISLWTPFFPQVLGIADVGVPDALAESLPADRRVPTAVA